MIGFNGSVQNKTYGKLFVCFCRGKAEKGFTPRRGPVQPLKGLQNPLERSLECPRGPTCHQGPAAICSRMPALSGRTSQPFKQFPPPPQKPPPPSPPPPPPPLLSSSLFAVLKDPMSSMTLRQNSVLPDLPNLFTDLLPHS